MPFFPPKSLDIRMSGANLVAAFHRAQPPLVWRFDLERNHSFTIALQGDEGDWELGITSAKGEFYPIVHFVTREDAEEALNAVQKILMARRRSGFGRAFMYFLLVAVTVGFFYLVWSAIEHPPRSISAALPPPISMVPPPAPSAPPIARAAPPEMGPGNLPSGIPLPADQVLKPPK